MNLEALLAHRPWVRAFARKLVLDESRADDLEQQTWLAALKNPPQDAQSPRGWLAGVMRRQAARLWRSEGRRTQRERAVARTESVRSAAEVVADTERHRMVVEAVLALEEPYRATVLLRYFEGLPPREIAARLGVSVETVRSRIKRAIVMVRGRLDRDHGNDRRAWCVALLPLLGVDPEHLGKPVATGALTTGVIAMTTKLKITLAAVAALVLALTLWGLGSGPDGDAGDATDVATADETASDDEQKHRNRTQPAAPVAQEPESTEEAPAPEPEALPTSGGLLVLSGLGDEATAVAGATLRVVPTADEADELALTSDARGYAPLPEGATGAATVWATADGHASVRVAEVSMSEGPTRIVLPAERPVVVRFTLPDGTPLSADDAKSQYARSQTTPRAELVWNDALAGSDTASMLQTIFGDSADWHSLNGLRWNDGAIGLKNGLAPGQWRMLVWTPTGAPYITGVLDGAEPGTLEIDIPIAAQPDLIRARFVDSETGAPLASADVTPYFEYGDDQGFIPGAPRTTDADGVVHLPLPGPQGKDRFSGYMRGATWWLVTDTHVGTVSYGGMRRRKGGDEFELRVPRTATLEGRAFGRSGAPAVGARVTQRRKGWSVSTVVDAEGRYRLEGVFTGRSQATVFLIEDLAAMKLDQKRIEVTPGAEVEADIGTETQPGTTAAISGLLTVAGRPVKGILVGVRAEGVTGKGVFASTDAEGRFALDALQPGGAEVRMLFGDVRASDDYGLRSTDRIPLAAGDQKSLEFDLPAGVVQVTVIDAETKKPIVGAAVLCNPQTPDAGKDHFPGYSTRFGWSAMTDKTGVARMIGLPPQESHQVRVFAQGYEKLTQPDQIPGSAEVPRAVEIRMRKVE